MPLKYQLIVIDIKIMINKNRNISWDVISFYNWN